MGAAEAGKQLHRGSRCSPDPAAPSPELQLGSRDKGVAQGSRRTGEQVRQGRPGLERHKVPAPPPPFCSIISPLSSSLLSISPFLPFFRIPPFPLPSTSLSSHFSPPFLPPPSPHFSSLLSPPSFHLPSLSLLHPLSPPHLPSSFLLFPRPLSAPSFCNGHPTSLITLICFRHSLPPSVRPSRLVAVILHVVLETI